MISLALLAALAATNAHAEGFKATVGYENVNPKSNNGQLAGAEANVSDDWGFTGSLGYNFDDNWSADVWTGLTKFKHEVGIAGLGTVANVEHRPTTLTVNYHFMPAEKFSPYVGIGYGWVNVSGEEGVGALAGTQVRASNANGLTYVLGADVAVTDNVFIRGSVRKLDFDSDVTVNGAAVGTANVDPLVYGISAGFKF
ncbi:hypothetical protein N789_12800 [Arenimonas oryziterrae DSM 21050 = YC6267]|uniref:OmpW family protein n=1 Tax=Arenimonas oryziterrae DSM 21050 = YC6267 TaxID=1121015 RepID=A0A091ATM8_9GAMM|nr:hypothetical protein N789_12800 [Arenimonas oryziterrae DSM 21050 = YC6267]